MSTQQLDAEQVFNAARLKNDRKERAGYLDGACGKDVGLRAKVEALLAADAEAGSFLRMGIEGSRDQGIANDLDATIPQGSQRPVARAFRMKVTSTLPLSVIGQPRAQLPQ